MLQRMSSGPYVEVQGQSSGWLSQGWAPIYHNPFLGEKKKKSGFNAISATKLAANSTICLHQITLSESTGAECSLSSLALDLARSKAEMLWPVFFVVPSFSESIWPCQAELKRDSFYEMFKDLLLCQIAFGVSCGGKYCDEEESWLGFVFFFFSPFNTLWIFAEQVSAPSNLFSLLLQAHFVTINYLINGKETPQLQPLRQSRGK